MTGTLFGIGVGPGASDLITLRGRDVLARVPVVAFPCPEGGKSLVRSIAAPHIPAGRIEVAIETPMAVETFPAQAVYDRYATVLAEHLLAGRDVAVLCEGDPFLYGSFMYLFDRLVSGFPCKIVPGVSSLAASSAVAGVPLVSRNEILTILPAPLPDEELERQLCRCDSAAIMKVGRHFERVRQVLERLGLSQSAIYIERATMEEETVCKLADASGPAPYFSTILVRGQRTAALAGRTVNDRGVPRGSAIVVLNQTSIPLAHRLASILPDSFVHGPATVTGTSRVFDSFAGHLRNLFFEGTPIVGICAAGILIRTIAPSLADKRIEPPVVAVAEDGSVAVPLLGGHRGGNRIARALARGLGGVAAVTTASDARYGIGLDDPPVGWRVATPDSAKRFATALLNGRPVSVGVEAGTADWLEAGGIALTPESTPGDFRIRITDQRVDGTTQDFVLHPPVLCVGVGCERDAEPKAVIALVRQTLEAHGLAEGAVAGVVSIDVKADEPAVHAVAASWGVPARFFSAVELERETPRLVNPSAIVYREVGCHGVAEAAALAAAGSEGELIVPKVRGARATCAIARSPRPLDMTCIGRARGRLTVVGIGPGDAAWRTPEASAALAGASDLVGYQLYLDLLGTAILGKRHHTAPMTEEETRVRQALDLAAEGRQVALVSSGDAGIYGLASLCFELLEREQRPEWNRIELVVVPGLSAFQAAAARLGAPTGHDFCVISLSDLLTPWPIIESRLQAAGQGDFVIALYNPVSQRRRQQLIAARDILLRHRPAATPVALVRNAGRHGEAVKLLDLAELSPNDADMLTVIIVGSSQTRRLTMSGRTWLYTPRGYHAKHELADRSRQT